MCEMRLKICTYDAVERWFSYNLQAEAYQLLV